MGEWKVIATWPFGRGAAEAAAATLAAGGSILDAVVAGASAVEDDPTCNSVGYGGLADRDGIVTLDASVMDGARLDCGAVAGVENIRYVTELARRVMERTPHTMLVGNGAQRFALQQGFALENLQTSQSLAQWETTQSKPGISRGPMPDPTQDHDTVTVLGIDVHGHFAGACTTSGLAHKLPGRVGDSPIIGAGLYVDDTAGAAGGTGVGEEITRMAGSYAIVERLRAGDSAQAACEWAARRVLALADRRGVAPAAVAFLALDRQGNAGGACTPGTKFQYALATPAGIEMIVAPEIGA